MATQEWKDANREKMRAYRREWYYRNRESSIRRAAATRLEAKRIASEYVTALKANPCTDCGGRFHPWAMQFDHVGTDKTAGISRMVTQGMSLKRIKAEIAKCELVCANCHAVRTYTRWRETAEPHPGDEESPAA